MFGNKCAQQLPTQCAKHVHNIALQAQRRAMQAITRACHRMLGNRPRALPQMRARAALRTCATT
eukprot:1493477-Prorocentrum_lima.AAC.1